MKKFTIGIVGDHYLGWTGGANIAGYLLRSLIVGAENTNAKIIFLLNGSNIDEKLFLDANYILIESNKFEVDGPFSSFLSIATELNEIYFYRNLNKAIEDLGIDIIGPSGTLINVDACPWASYITDFQHKYIPEFFTRDERINRDIFFRDILEKSDCVYVNSKTVADDINRFYPKYSESKLIYQFPMFGIDIFKNYEESNNVIKKYQITNPYIISCSQRWKHKQHHTIINAYYDFLKKNPNSNLELIFTGDLNDFRFPEYKSEIENLIFNYNLKNRIKNLGLVPRADQLSLIHSSEGLIQASLFEGGAGASGMYEAIMLGVPVFASNIAANLELKIGNTIYFEKENEFDLSKKMNKYFLNNKKNTYEKLFNYSELILMERYSGMMIIKELFFIYKKHLMKKNFNLT